MNSTNIYCWQSQTEIEACKSHDLCKVARIEQERSAGDGTQIIDGSESEERYEIIGARFWELPWTISEYQNTDHNINADLRLLKQTRRPGVRQKEPSAQICSHHPHQHLWYKASKYAFSAQRMIRPRHHHTHTMSPFLIVSKVKARKGTINCYLVVLERVYELLLIINQI